MARPSGPNEAAAPAACQPYRGRYRRTEPWPIRSGRDEPAGGVEQHVALGHWGEPLAGDPAEEAVEQDHDPVGEPTGREVVADRADALGRLDPRQQPLSQDGLVTGKRLGDLGVGHDCANGPDEAADAGIGTLVRGTGDVVQQDSDGIAAPPLRLEPGRGLVVPELDDGQLSWPHIDWPDLPWPDWQVPSLPDWLRELMAKLKYLWPVLLAAGLAHAEVRRRRQQDMRKARGTAEPNAQDARAPESDPQQAGTSSEQES